jgi:hypothetical protein
LKNVAPERTACDQCEDFDQQIGSYPIGPISPISPIGPIPFPINSSNATPRDYNEKTDCEEFTEAFWRNGTVAVDISDE